jgi:hypothetical protein
VLSGAPENALAESESTLLRSRGAWKHLELLGSTGEVYRSVWEVYVWLVLATGPGNPPAVRFSSGRYPAKNPNRVGLAGWLPGLWFQLYGSNTFASHEVFEF